MLGIILKYTHATCISRLFLLYWHKPNADFNSAKSLSVGGKKKKYATNIPLFILENEKWNISERFPYSSTPTPHISTAELSFSFLMAEFVVALKKKITKEKVGFRCKHQSTKKQTCHSCFKKGWVMKISIQLNYPGSVKNFTVVWWITIKLNFKVFFHFQ